MDPLKGLVNPLVLYALCLASTMFSWWAFGFEFTIIILLMVIIATLRGLRNSNRF